MNSPQIADSNSPTAPLSPKPVSRGRWKWGAGIFLVACIAQTALWTLWWEDPTHFKMSVLFVWPAALFAMTIWWIFFSGWSWLLRLGSVVTIAAVFVGFLSAYRLEFDGDMVPRRLVLRSKPTADELTRRFLKQKSVETDQPVQSKTAILDESPLVTADGDWPGFRGPLRDGIVHGGSLRRNWDTAPPQQIWRHPVGRAWSGFAVVGNYAFTQEQRDENECVVAYHANTGEQIWEHQDKTMLSIVDANGGPGPHATPQFDDGLVYTLGGTGLLNCLNATTGKKIWSTNILQDARDEKALVKMPEWGMSASPLVVDNLVIVIPGGASTEGAPGYEKGVAAYDKKTGQLIWAFGKHAASYGSPRVETIAETRQLLIPNANGLSGHSLENGHELWFFPLENGPKVNSAMPWLVDQDSLIFGTGYGIGSVREVIKNVDGKWETVRQWSSNRFRPKFNDFVVFDGHVYGLDDGTLTCLDIQKGTIKWKSGRYGYGQLLLVDDVLMIISEDGDLVLVPATPKKPEPVATFKVFDSGFCWNHLAFVRGRLLARNANEAVCLDVSVSK